MKQSGAALPGEVSGERDARLWYTRWWWWWPIPFSVVGIGVALYYAMTSTPHQAADVGNFVAGFAGALAFIWLVAGYQQQGEELKLQRPGRVAPARGAAASCKSSALSASACH